MQISKNFILKQNLNKNIFIKNSGYNYKNYFCIPMLPYPSGSLHIGHVRNYLINDIFNRFLRINNYNIYSFIGWDSFGTPAENISLANNTAPNKWIYKNILYMKKQFKLLGFFWKWKNRYLTSNKIYYKWNQFIFVNLLKKKLIYIKSTYVNWDPVDKTILSNEQVINGKSWRSGAKIKFVKKQTYFINLLKYKLELYNELKNLNWPKKVKLMQINWLGNLLILLIKLVFILFKILNICFINSSDIKYFFDIYIIFIYINSNICKKILKIYKYLRFYTHRLKLNYQYINTSLNFKNILQNKKFELWLIKKKKFGDKKFFINKILNKISYFNLDFNCLEFNYFCKFKYISIYKYYNFWKINDWSVSRQRYWGTPIPISKCNLCGNLSKFKNLIKLPKYLKSSIYINPLKQNKLFWYSICPKCKNNSYAEIDTLDTFFDSSWYFLNYIDFKNHRSNNINKWLPVDFYVGGVEHAILHLLYSRFIIKFLRDIKLINFGEPFTNLYVQGMILNKTFYIKINDTIKWINISESKNFKNLCNVKLEKMSKSKYNGINPIELIKFYGIDPLRLSVIYSSYLDKDFVWDEKYIIYCFKNLLKFLKLLFTKNSLIINKLYINNLIIYNDKLFLYFLYKNLSKINQFYIKLKYNKVISTVFVLLNMLKTKFNFTNFLIFNEINSIILRVIYPIVPHISYKLWNRFKFNKKLTNILYIFWPNIYKIKLRFYKKKKYILFINNKKIDILEIEVNLYLINQILNLLTFKTKFYINKFNLKLILNKNIINLII